MRNEPKLTNREREIIRLIAGGYSDKEIAVKLGIGRRTVSNHVTVMLTKLRAARRAQAVAEAYRYGLIVSGERIP